MTTDITQIKCLITDDHKLAAQIINNGLASLNIQKYEFNASVNAANGLVAYEKLELAHKEGIPFDIVFLDWNMPEMNGYDLLCKCRADKKYDQTAFVMVTAESEQNSILEAMSAGATSYISKPFVAADLEKKLLTTIKWLEAKREPSKP